MARPVIYVLAGVNGAGKSSVGGYALTVSGAHWFNPDTFARELIAASGCDQDTANGHAWTEGMRRLSSAIDARDNFAFETTLGGNSVAAALKDATTTHDVVMWFCGLVTVDLHLARVQMRVAAGGHDIPEAKIRERYDSSRHNLIQLMPLLHDLRVYDNSEPADADGSVPDPVLLLITQKGRIRFPDPRSAEALHRTPDWAKPLMAAALRLQDKRKR